MSAVNRGQAREFFAYTETAAQHACFTIRNYRRKSLGVIESSYPEGAERAELIKTYRAAAEEEDGADIFELYSSRYGWLERLRRDMSGIERVEVQGERATVQTVLGTRYPFRLRDNGIWGLTLFPGRLVAEAEKAARDHSMVERAAKDYARVKRREASGK
jgi:hypothetical protein